MRLHTMALSMLAVMVWSMAAPVHVDAYATVEEQYNDLVKSWVNAKLKQMDEEIPPMKSSELWDHILTPDFISRNKDERDVEAGQASSASSGKGGSKFSKLKRTVRNIQKKFGDVSRDAFKQGPVYQRRRDLKMIQSLYVDHVGDTTAELEKLLAPGERMMISTPPWCCNKFDLGDAGKKKSSNGGVFGLMKKLKSQKNTAALIEEGWKGLLSASKNQAKTADSSVAKDESDCSESRCRQNKEKFSERLMLDLASFATYLSERAAALRGKRAAQILSDRLFRQSHTHEQMSTKPTLPGSLEIGRGFSVPRGVTVGSYFSVNTYNIERSRITSELSGRYSIPAALDVIPMHRYDEPRIQVFSDIPQFTRKKAEEHRISGARSMLAHSPEALHLQVS